MKVHVIFLLLPFVACKIFDKCELGQELLNNGIPKDQIADWLCLVKYESNYNSSAKGGPNGGKRVTRGSYDWGLFQFNDYYWCDTVNNPRYNDCHIKCDQFLDDEIRDDIRCAKKVYRRHGFSAWYGWRRGCRNRDVTGFVANCDFKE